MNEDLGTEVEVAEEATATEVEEVTEKNVSEAEIEDTEESVQEDESEAETDEDEEQEEVVEEYEFNFGGSKLAVPKNASVEEVAESLQTYANSIEAAHTKRSQAVAETSKSLEAREAAIQKLEGLSGDALEAYSKGVAIRQELSELGSVNLTELWQVDPDRARRVSDTISQKQAEFNSVVNLVSQKEQELSKARSEEMNRRLSEGKQQVVKQVKDFEAKVPEVVEYVTKTYGIPKEEAEQWPINPSGAIMAYKAMLYDNMQSKLKKTAKSKPVPVNPSKPIKAKGKTQAKSLSDIQDPDEYERRWLALQKQKG